MCASNQRVLPKIQSGFYLVQASPSSFRFFLPPQVESIIVCSDTVGMLRDLCPHKNIGSVTAAAEDYGNPPPRPWIIDKRTKKKRGGRRREDKREGEKKKTDPSFQTSSHYNLGTFHSTSNPVYGGSLELYCPVILQSCAAQDEIEDHHWASPRLSHNGHQSQNTFQIYDKVNYDCDNGGSRSQRVQPSTCGKM